MTVLGLLGLCLGHVPSIQVLRVYWGRALWLRGSSAVGGWRGSLSDSLGFTLKGRQKPLCVQALTSSSTSHPTRPGPFKKKKKILSSPWWE